MGFIRRKRNDPDRAAAEAQARQLEQEIGAKLSVMPRDELTELAWPVAERVASLYLADLPEKVQTACTLFPNFLSAEREFAGESLRGGMSMPQLGRQVRLVEEEDYDARPHVPEIAAVIEGLRTDPAWKDRECW